MLSKYGIIKTSKRRFLYFVSLDRNLCESVVKNFVCILWLWFLVRHPLFPACPFISSRILSICRYIHRWNTCKFCCWFEWKYALASNIQLGYGSRSFHITWHVYLYLHILDLVWPFLRLPILLMNFVHIQRLLLYWCYRINMDIDWARRKAGKTGANEWINVCGWPWRGAGVLRSVNDRESSRKLSAYCL